MAKSLWLSKTIQVSFSLHNNDTVAKFTPYFLSFTISFSLHNNDTVAKFYLLHLLGD
ncbi:MAG: hypothetical protein ACRCVI_01080 [Mycoplasmoidaceae bacterium]